MGIAEIVALIVTVGPIVAQILRLISAKIENEKDAKLFRDAAKAVEFAEELAAANPELVKGGKDKLDQALRAFQQKNPKISITEAKTILQATLPQLGLGAAAKKRSAGISAALNGQ